MTTVDLIYDPDCPNVQEARGNLMKAFVASGMTPAWHEWDLHGTECPDYARGCGSPSTFVNGVDVGASNTVIPAGSSCRLYQQPDGAIAKAPSVSQISAALTQSHTKLPVRSNWRAFGSATMAVGTALLPKIGCPACWPAYAAVLGSLGIGFVNYTPYILPLMTGFLALTLFLLGYRARTRNGYGPLLLGLVASGLVLGGKYVLGVDSLLFFGVGLLVVASLWNSLPLRRRSTGACPACVRQNITMEKERSS